MNWVDIFSVGTTGGLNYNATVNLTDRSYDGANADLIALVNGSDPVVTLSWSFPTSISPQSDLIADGTTHATSYSGAFNAGGYITVPVPPTLLLLGSGLLGLVGLGYRKKRKA